MEPDKNLVVYQCQCLPLSFQYKQQQKISKPLGFLVIQAVLPTLGSVVSALAQVSPAWMAVQSNSSAPLPEILWPCGIRKEDQYLSLAALMLKLWGITQAVLP